MTALPALAGGEYVTYTNETSARLLSAGGVGAQDLEEKDYAWGDVDNDLDVDLVSVRKQPFTTSGGRRNVLFINDGGVLTDMSDTYIPGFLEATNDRDVVVVDVNNDGWLDIVTAAACNFCNSGSIVDDSRLYLNLGEDGGGNWLGYDDPVVLFGNGNNFCAVAAGDVDGDDYADLFFVSYNDSFEDQFMLNEGAANPGSFVLANERLTSSMRASSFGSAAFIVDMDNDGDNDIVKSENGPVEIFRNNGSGFFDLLDPTYSGAAYHVGVGDLNGDGMLDLVISDDGTDRYILNNGNLINGSPDATNTFPASTGGFGSNSVVADLDGDGNNEALIADVDVDAPGCQRVTDILRNTGASFVTDSGNIPNSQLDGVHDIAVFDLNGDSALDLVIGRCSGTQVWVNSPPVAIAFDYPGGLPDFVDPGATTNFDVQLTPEGDTIADGTPAIHIAVNGGAFEEFPLVPEAGDMYSASLPAGECADRFDYFISAETEGGLEFTDPPLAPSESFTAVAAEGTETLFVEAFEADVSDWTVTSDPSLTGGEWEAVDPIAALVGGDLSQPSDDATPDGTIAFITENPENPGDPFGTHDVDGGPTYLTSPSFDLSGGDGFVTYARWAFSAFDIHDFLVIEISNDGGSSWVQVDTVADTAGAWETASFFVSDFVTPSNQMVVRFSIEDTDGSTTEAGVDDFEVDTLVCGANPCPWDGDGDGNVGTTDFLDLLANWGECTGECIWDFDGDGNVGTTDFLDLLANWGSCP